MQTLTTPAFRNAEALRDEYAEWLQKIEAPQRQDANDRVWQARAILSHDVLHGLPLDEVARSSPVSFLVIVAAEDRMVAPAPALVWAKAAGAQVYVSRAECAHLIMSCDAPAVRERVSSFSASRLLRGLLRDSGADEKDDGGGAYVGARERGEGGGVDALVRG